VLRSFWARWRAGSKPAPAADPVEPSLLEAARAVFLAQQEQQRERQEARREQARRAREAAGRVRQALESLVAGYNMSLQRVERGLRQHGLEAVATVGAPFDPERMEVLEAVSGSGRPSGEVIEEVRRGYLWNGRVFRYAQVRVARE
jgi:molecular chaperone GrpE